MSWREEWIPASYKGVEFFVENASRGGGRRGIEWEFPKRDDPYFEDLGRRARLWSVTGYVLGPDYKSKADALERALNSKGAGTLQHPTMRTMRVVALPFMRHERKMAGGYAEFEMSFAEAGQSMIGRGAEDTAGLMTSAANNAASSSTAAFNSSTASEIRPEQTSQYPAL